MEFQFCRICLNSIVTLVDIFAQRQQINPDNPEPCLADMLNEIADCHIKLEDELSQKICLSCVLGAQNAWRFKRMCEQSYQHLITADHQPKQEQILEPAESEEDGSYENGDMIFIKLEPNVKIEEETTDVILKPYKCNICSKAFADLRILRVHKKWHAENKSKTSASLPKSMPTSIQKRNKTQKLKTVSEKKLRSKLKYVITSDQTVQCPDCTKVFRHPDHLKRHMRIHTGECPYQCPYCKDTFYRSDYCKAHIKKMHKGLHIPKTTRAP